MNKKSCKTVEFTAIAVVKSSRAKGINMQYSNVCCGECHEWWIMVNLRDKKKVRCPWCGAKCKVKKHEADPSDDVYRFNN